MPGTPPDSGVRDVEPLRDRRKRELRQQLSDTATRMFLEHGFDAVRVTDVARACGVTEKTVFNHFRSKEALLADRWDIQIATLDARLNDPQTTPVDAAVSVLDSEIEQLVCPRTARRGRAHLRDVRRFGELIQSTPALLAHNREQLDRLTTTAAAALAVRTHTDPADPETWITATALAGLWTVVARALHRHLAGSDPTRIAAAIKSDLRRAAGVLRHGVDDRPADS